MKIGLKEWKTLARNRVALASVIFLVIISLVAIAAPWVSPYSFDEQDIAARLQGPSLEHWMGTDTLGRDLLSRIFYGARMSLAIGICTALFALVLGTFTGAVAGYWRGVWDIVLMRVVDAFQIFPMTLMSILFMLLFGRGFFGIFMALGLATWVTQARLVRALVLQAREQAYVEAAQAVGVSSWSTIFKHIIPNLWGPMIVALTYQIPNNIMAESFLSFVGLGLQPPYSSWGTLANEGFRGMRSYPYLMIYPGTVLFLTMLAFNYLGDSLRDLLDPKSHFSTRHF